MVDDAQRGDVVEWDGWKLEVAAMDGLGVERIVARRAAGQCHLSSKLIWL